MEQETTEKGSTDHGEHRWRRRDRVYCHGSGGALYVLGFIGALVYYLTTATGVLEGFIGFLKALVWPAFLIYGLLKFLGM